MNIVKRDPFNAFLDTPGPEITSGTGPLSDCTVAIKDIFDVAGYRTGCGNPQKQAESEPAKNTAPAVAKLFEAGAQFIGKTQTEELAFSLTGDNAHYPRPINPVAPDRLTGGSSSGSIAAVASRLADIATGSDTGGSVRLPASHCGRVGLRTSHGAISLEGAMPLAPSFDVFGWFARDMELYETISELYFPPSSFSNVRPLRLPEQEAQIAGNEERESYLSALATVENIIGQAQTTAISSVDVDRRYWCMRVIQGYEAWQSHGEWISAANPRLGPGVKDRFEYGSKVDAETLRTDSGLREELTSEISDLIGDDGVLITPTVPGPAPLVESGFDAFQDYRERSLRLLCISGLTGLPELTLPVCQADGAPFGLSLIGPKGSDRALLALGRKILASQEKGAG